MNDKLISKIKYDLTSTEVNFAIFRNKLKEERTGFIYLKPSTALLKNMSISISYATLTHSAQHKCPITSEDMCPIHIDILKKKYYFISLLVSECFQLL